MSKLFTPGPLNTADAVRAAMNADIGSRTAECEHLTLQICQLLLNVCGEVPGYKAVLLQGSGTFAVEAMLATFVGTSDKVLVIVNGVYARRMAEICRIHRLRHSVLESSELEAVPVEEVEKALAADSEISHVALVHYETALGVTNPLSRIVSTCRKYGVRTLIDAMSSFGALEIQLDAPTVACVVASANKCLHGVPGVGFAILHEDTLLQTSEKRTLSLDLKQQHVSLQKTGQWRFTPPVQVLLAFRQALLSYFADGGLPARARRYDELMKNIEAGFSALGVYPLIARKHRSPIINTFVFPQESRLDELFSHLESSGLIIYRSPERSCFRVGCIGELDSHDVDQLIGACGEYLRGHGNEA